MKPATGYLVICSLFLAACGGEKLGTAVSYSDNSPSEIIVQMPADAPSITQQFRRRSIDPALRNETSDHLGIDVAGQSGVAIIAAAPGRVLRSFAGPAYGNRIVIEHGADDPAGRMTTTYLHLKSRLVGVGDTVRRGQQIGTMGATGVLAAGLTHLHFETRHQGASGRIEPVDPHLLWLDGVGLVTCFDAGALQDARPLRMTFPVACEQGSGESRNHVSP